MTERRGAISDSGFISLKINENLNMKEKKILCAKVPLKAQKFLIGPSTFIDEFNFFEVMPST